MTPKKAASIIKTVEKHMTAVAKVRDNLDDAISELEELRDDCRTAWDCLSDARDALSELV
jgi:hypothetical protein